MSPTVLWANTSGCSFASATVVGSSGHPGAIVAYPAASKAVRQRSQLLGNSQRPWTNTTGCLPEALAASTCSASYSRISAVRDPALPDSAVLDLAMLIAPSGSALHRARRFVAQVLQVNIIIDRGDVAVAQIA